MAEILTEVVYVGHDNVIELELTEDGNTVDLSSVLKVVVDFGAIEIDSDQTAAGIFTWNAQGRLTMKLGLVPAIADMVGTHVVRLTVYSAEEPNGVVWLERMVLRVIGPKEL